MSLLPGQIVRNLVPHEPVRITDVQPMKSGQMLRVAYVGMSSNRADTRILSEQQVVALEVMGQEGSHSFTGKPEHFKLFAEAERIHSAYQFDPLFAVNCSVVDPLPHQVEAVYKYLLPLPQIRFLLADDTGAGKTVMTGLLLKELLMRGLIERVLIVTPGGLTKQWQEDEMGQKFNLDFKLVNRSAFDSDPNIFRSSDKLVTSIDFLRADDVMTVLKEVRWDLVVVDEAHKLTAFDYGQKKYVSKRYEAVQILAQRSDHLLLLTATPHRGRKDTFKNLLQLLDEDIFASDTLVTERIRTLEAEGVNRFFIRRLKEEMQDWQGTPLFKDRYTKTIGYDLSPGEKRLYDEVTRYLTQKKEEAQATRNIHVTLALTVMQRRLVSSLVAIQRTLHNRYRALKGLLDDLAQNPHLLSQKFKNELLGLDDMDDYDELDDSERGALESILSDPRKFQMFTTARNVEQIKTEVQDVKYLVDLADDLVNSGQEERKFTELTRLLRQEGVFDKTEKLVLFTEHKDTLDYLEQKLKGYGVVTIHGGKSVDERRLAQARFAQPDVQILLATDAAGEGINLQFCRLLINWDIPWNPNRLEQRMGRIHRYGQKRDVLVFNLVAQNTREGAVLQRLLTKLDVIRSQMGEDRVYDVIQDVLQDVRLDDIVRSVFDGQRTRLDDLLDQPTEQWQSLFSAAIREQREKLGHSAIAYADAQRLKEHSDEHRLQPLYIRQFFEQAFRQLGGSYRESYPSVFRVTHLPPSIEAVLKRQHRLTADWAQTAFCFDKQVFLDFQLSGTGPRLHYVNPGNPTFDALVTVVRQQYRDDVLQGTVLVTPEEATGYLAYFVRSQITDRRPHLGGESTVADERLALVLAHPDGTFSQTSPAKLLDLLPPAVFAKTPDVPDSPDDHAVLDYAYEAITEPQYEHTRRRVADDTAQRRGYLERAFDDLILDLVHEISQLQVKLLEDRADETRLGEKISRREQQIADLQRKRADRLARLDAQLQLDIRAPEVLGCACVVPLSQLEYQTHFGMHRDDEVEAIAMQTALAYEQTDGRTSTDVSAQNLGYDLRSVDTDQRRRYIEVKGRAHSGPVVLTENEMNRLAQLGEAAWLYLVTHCKTGQPQLHPFQNPAKRLTFEARSRGVQYLLAEEEWKRKTTR